MRIALAQVNQIVGDIPYNSRKIVDFAQRARQQGGFGMHFPRAVGDRLPAKGSAA